MIQLQGEHNAAMSSVRKQLDQLMKESADQQAKHKIDYEQSCKKLTQFYDQKHKELGQEVADIMLSVKNEIVQLNASIQIRLRDNLTLFSQQSRQEQQQAQSMLAEVKAEVDLLMRFQNQYRP